ncbi:uncharacterized protein I206_100039 [Kwoniella pini CBS 10737]|uniref:Exonuclease V n=1 Tax=Kwoniella pini CBS 10737 TaxID=1296096 RepID=A0A1B9HSE4_9TREE|nr:uncharacterized protein I206_07854 [Kwoniella pini CBS 10737]OCF46184.1 hypothetical protein I206_07854 [Kwoniella pini CBS 10737]
MLVDSEDEFNFDIPYDEEMELALQAAEIQSQPFLEMNVIGDMSVMNSNLINTTQVGIHDIEDTPLEVDMERLSPFQQFRKRGHLSVSDLVGPIWCETQYDYRLRTLPYLPPSQRPDVIKSKEGNEIVIDKVKVEGKERILKRGEKIHKRLEREIHPAEIMVPVTTEEDKWGLRFLNMLVAMQALLDLGKCRELPVVGFVKGILVYGIIDELVREPIASTSTSENLNTSNTQTSLTSFFTSSRVKASSDTKPRTHKIYISDSKTRASGVLPREDDTLAGRLQVMLYKELLDSILISSTRNPASSSNPQNKTGGTSILPSRNDFSWQFVFAHLGLDPRIELSKEFLEQSKSVIYSNGLKLDTDKARTLNDMIEVWNKYVQALGLGTPPQFDQANSRNASKAKGNSKGKAKEEERNLGVTEDVLKLVYRRAGGKKKNKTKHEKQKGDRSSKRPRRGRKVSKVFDNEEQGEPPPFLNRIINEQSTVEEEEDRLVRLAIEESLKSSDTSSLNEGKSQDIQDDSIIHSESEVPPRPPTRTSEQVYRGSDEDDDDDKEDDELAWAVEMSLNPGLEGPNVVGSHEIINGQGVVHVNVNTGKSLESSQQKTSRTDESQSSIDETHSMTSTPALEDPMVGRNDKEDEEDNQSSGTIIGTHRFKHSSLLLARHLENVFQFWMGEREPSGVSLEETRRCGWCEFEENCEWRLKKAEEIWKSRKVS